MTTRQNDVRPKVLSFQEPRTYQIRFQGILDERWFSGLGLLSS